MKPIKDPTLLKPGDDEVVVCADEFGGWNNIKQVTRTEGGAGTPAIVAYFVFLATTVGLASR